MKKLHRLAAGALLASAAMAGSASAEVIRVDLQPSPAFANGSAVNFTGVETKAAAINPLFGSQGTNTWNYLTLPPYPTLTKSVAFLNLVDSTGLVTTVGFSIDGSISNSGISAADNAPIDNVGSDALENDYFLTLHKKAYTISGLPANTSVAFYTYAPNFVVNNSEISTSPSRGYLLTANGVMITVASGPSNDALAYVTTDATGAVSGIWSTPNDANEGDWSGFQVAYTVPEPGSLELVAGSMLATAGIFWGRRSAAGRPPRR